MKVKLSVVVPAYNEEENIKKGVLKELRNYLQKQDYSWEVLLVDDKSTDNTLSLLKKFAKSHQAFKVIAESHRGKGGTVIVGILQSKGEIVLFTDADQATPITELEKFWDKFNNGYDIVIGSRSGRRGAPMIRKLMAYGFTLLRFLILRLPYKDTQCGFKAFKKDSAKEIFKRLEVYKDKTAAEGAHVTAGFDLEVLYIARKLGLKVAEVPVKWQHKETERINAVKDSFEGLKDLAMIRINALLGKYR